MIAQTLSMARYSRMVAPDVDVYQPSTSSLGAGFVRFVLDRSSRRIGVDVNSEWSLRAIVDGLPEMRQDLIDRESRSNASSG